MGDLLVFGSRLDLHLRRVGDQLRRRGVDLLFFESTAEDLASVRLGPGADFTISADVLDRSRPRVVNLRDGLCWLRNKSSLNIIGNRHQQRTFFRMAERTALIHGIVSAFDVPHFNDLGATRRHENKLAQLRFAADVGFAIPDTLISSDPERIRDFVASGGRAITKPLRTTVMPSSRDGAAPALRLMTEMVVEEELASAADEELAVAPAIYQRYVEKDHEIRLVATCCGMVAWRLDSQVSAAAAVDWRRDSRGFPSAVTAVPEGVRTLIVRYMAAAGLAFGAFDFIVRPCGGWVYVECNVEGQWGWLEDEDDCPGSELVADTCIELMRGRALWPKDRLTRSKTSL